MPKPTKSTGSARSTKNDLPFEEALKRLETVVETMEEEELPLEMLLDRFEEGTRLARRCQEKLAQAEVRIQKLEKDSGGELTLKALEETASDES